MEPHETVLAEIQAPGTPLSRLYDLAGCDEPALAAAARLRLVEVVFDDDFAALITSATDPHEQVGVALKLVVKALDTFPAQIAAFAVSDLLEVLDQIGGDEELGRTLFDLVQVKVRSKGAEVEEMARSLAGSFAGTIDELMVAAVLAERNTRATPN